MDAIIVGKGPSARYIKKSDHTNTLLVAINQACIFIDEIDFLFMNDIEALSGLEETQLKSVNRLVIPEWPHKNGWLDKPRTSHLDFKVKLSEICVVPPPVLLHNLWSNPLPNPLLPCTDTCVTTMETAISYLAKVHDIKTITTYGYNIPYKNTYHTDLNHLKHHSNIYSSIINEGYDKLHMCKIKKSIDSLTKKYDLKVTCY